MNWKLEIANLRSRADDVYAARPSASGLAAREVARILSGVAQACAQRYGQESMQAAFATLALDERAWRTRMAVLPRDEHGKLDPSVELISTVVRGIISASSVDAIRAAVSFWGAENDHAVWQQIAA